MIKKAIIIGSGPSGLITAWKLLEKGWRVELIEKNKITGGKTVKPIYRILDKSTFINKNIFLSDERLVPYSSNLSNYMSKNRQYL